MWVQYHVSTLLSLVNKDLHVHVPVKNIVHVFTTNIHYLWKCTCRFRRCNFVKVHTSLWGIRCMKIRRSNFYKINQIFKKVWVNFNVNHVGQFWGICELEWSLIVFSCLKNKQCKIKSSLNICLRYMWTLTQSCNTVYFQPKITKWLEAHL